MTQKNTPTLVPWKNEPLMRLLAWKLTPVELGISFLMAISIPLCLSAYLLEREFFANISWSATVVFLFPFLVGLGLKYYEEIPRLFDDLFEEVVEDVQKESQVNFYAWLNTRFNQVRWTALALATSLLCSFTFFRQKQRGCQNGWTDWLFGGDYFVLGADVFPGCGFTDVGVFAAVVILVMVYWMVNLATRAAICYWGLYEFFNSGAKYGFAIELQILHPDRCCGLRRIGEVAMLFNVILFIIGIYISLTVIDKILLQDRAAFADISIPVYVALYLLAAPMLFFLPLGSARREMKQAKIDFMRPISEKCEVLVQESAAREVEHADRAVNAFFEIHRLKEQVYKDIPVWPFDFSSFLKFSGAVVFPVAPVIATILTEFVRRVFLS